MIPAGPGLRAIIRINGQLALGVVFAALGRWSWSHVSAEWWQLGIIAPISATSAFVLFVGALGEIKSFVLRDRRIRAYRRQGTVLKSDRLASTEALRREGLIK